MQDYPNSYLYRRIVAAKLYIDRHYSRDIVLDSIAGEACFSKFHFIRLFRKIYGCTPHQYLIAVRLDAAKGLLARGKPVAAVCTEIGFESLSTFAGLFKRATGLAPAAYQQLQMRHVKQIATAPLRYVPHCFAAAHGWAL